MVTNTLLTSTDLDASMVAVSIQDKKGGSVLTVLTHSQHECTPVWRPLFLAGTKPRYEYAKGDPQLHDFMQSWTCCC